MPGDDLASRVRGVATTATVAALLCLGVPLGVAARVVVVGDERGEVERAAATVAAELSVDPPTAGDRPELPPSETSTRVGYYDGAATLVVGRGPQPGDETVRRGAAGAAVTGGSLWSPGSLLWRDPVAAAPVTDGAAVVGVVRVAGGGPVLWWRTLAAWSALAAVGAAALVTARALATRAAARVAAPMDRLRAAATAVGAGDLTRRVPGCGIREIDAVGGALNTTVGRLGDLLHRERALGAAASHQLRTPVMRLQLLLDAARGDASAAGAAAPLLDQAAVEAGELAAQLEDLLRLTREGPGSHSTVEPVDLLAVLDDLERRHAPVLARRHRRLVVGGDADLPTVAASAPGLGHALDVLVDNALEHGRGTVRVWARETAGGVAVDVCDEGTGFDRPAPAGGVGLGLARALVEAQGGRLVLPGRPASSRVSVVLGPAPGAAATGDSR